MATTKKQTTATPATTVQREPVKPMASVQPATPVILDIASLTPDQLAKLQRQLKEHKKATAIDHESWVTIVDKMLHEKDETGFKWTTADILSTAQNKGIVPPTIDADRRAQEIKRIQTRKQLLEKKRDDKGNLMHDVGYKPSTNAFGPLTAERVMEWLMVPANLEAMTPTQVEACMKQLKLMA